MVQCATAGQAMAVGRRRGGGAAASHQASAPASPSLPQPRHSQATAKPQPRHSLATAPRARARARSQGAAATAASQPRSLAMSLTPLGFARLGRAGDGRKQLRTPGQLVLRGWGLRRAVQAVSKNRTDKEQRPRPGLCGLAKVHVPALYLRCLGLATVLATLHSPIIRRQHAPATK
jgi:hypothetical protein